MGSFFKSGSVSNFQNNTTNDTNVSVLDKEIMGIPLKWILIVLLIAVLVVYAMKMQKVKNTQPQPQPLTA